MQTEGGWINISEAARLYGKDRKWVYDQIKQYGLGTKKVGNRRLVQLVDLIAHRGESQQGAPKPVRLTPITRRKSHPITHLKQSLSSKRISFCISALTN